MSEITRRCPYCQRLHPSDDFKKIVRNRITINQCGPCYRGRQDKAANQARLDAMIAENKAANVRNYTGFMKEKNK